MDREDWERSLAGLEALLKQKKEELDKPKRLKQDIEEIELTISAYKKKIAGIPKK